MDFVTSRGPGTFSYVNIWSGATGLPLPNGSKFPYDPNFTGGAYVAMCDLDFDGHSDVVIGAGETGGSHVRVWSQFRNAWIDDFVLDNERSGVLVAGRPVALDSRGIKRDGRSPAVFGTNGMYMAHPGTTNVMHRHVAGDFTFTDPAGYGATQALAAGHRLEPVRVYPPQPAVAPRLEYDRFYTTGVSTPFHRWTFARRQGFFYDAETSTDLQTWKLEADLIWENQVDLITSGPRKFLRVKERVFFVP